MTMTSSRPFLVRALYDWILENDCTPYILVNAYADGVEVPQEHVKDGQIVLNISPSAVQDIFIRNESVDFDGRFAGIPKRVYVPITAVMGIYAKENGQGMIFEADGINPQPPTGSDDPGKPSVSPIDGEKKKPSLRVVK
ncbi:MAG: ClpXP protease specificity-enhancing factor [Gammaproteobacteria bacterium]|jgi:stringent starvation protein B|nr:ClpXP protease specificity-enhancing factor [Gammaproteobacteria bacterium]MBT3859938.1 ClpXP protease specificity-enhancing factor [Gammaproteobacteria bacterium]MBT3986400.1 ClpXP protease specificity-enhancing factor [Gammaproteobacteria bacterium]MBT4254677.1 ClpXP protease specificity-enhancing factor [Gammaproteobacteria bacterium]MBT4582960.1 ClpXP protease specificity-enhancing factor [Gammaproteobacteria bacterium]